MPEKRKWKDGKWYTYEETLKWYKNKKAKADWVWDNDMKTEDEERADDISYAASNMTRDMIGHE